MTIAMVRAALGAALDYLAAQRACVLIVGASEGISNLSPALRRNGRFDREIVLRKPDHVGREALLTQLTQGSRLGPDVDLKALANMSEGVGPSDLEGIPLTYTHTHTHTHAHTLSLSLIHKHTHIMRYIIVHIYGYMVIWLYIYMPRLDS